MENKKITFWEFLGACVLGAVIGTLPAIVYIYATGGF